MKRKRGFLLVIVVAILGPLTVLASLPPPDKVQKIDELLKRCNRDGQFNGAVLVAERGKIIYRQGFGFANFEWKNPVTPDTKFRIGSVTKSFTAILILQLVEQGKLKLDDRIGTFLPNFSKPPFDQITVSHLLMHTSGLPDYNNVSDFFRQVQSGLLSETEIVERIAHYDLLFTPGTKFGYSNDGYRLLGKIIEKITSKPYEQVLRENILVPLDMQNTGYAHQNSVLEKRASGYRKTLAGLQSAQYYLESPASGMYSTVEDLFKRDEALYGNKLLSQRSKDLMWQIVPSGNAYGWHVSNTDGVLTVKTDGAVFGFYARISQLPADHRTVILLTNIRGSINYLPEIETAITNILYDKPFERPKISVAETLLATFRRQGIGAATRQYGDLRSAGASRYNLAEGELNSLGYLLLDTERTAEAIEIFKLNVEAYPTSANTYDSLGAAYLRNGDREQAIRNYRRSLELDPRNTNAIKVLRTLNENN